MYHFGNRIVPVRFNDVGPYQLALTIVKKGIFIYYYNKLFFLLVLKKRDFSGKDSLVDCIF